MLKRVLCICGALTFAFALAYHEAEAAGVLKAYVDLDQDGVYEKVGEYSVSFEDALKAFAAAGGAPASGGEMVLNFKGVQGASFDVPQSWDGFIAFLDRAYGSANKNPMITLCDAIVWLKKGSLYWSCAGLSCSPDHCTGQFVAASGEFICRNRPPCPSNMPRCLPIANEINIVAFNTIGGTACSCSGGSCIIGPGTPSGLGILFDNDVCKCFAGKGWGAPSLSLYGFIVLTLLLAGTAVWVLRRRFAAE